MGIKDYKFSDRDLSIDPEMELDSYIHFCVDSSSISFNKDDIIQMAKYFNLVVSERNEDTFVAEIGNSGDYKIL